MLWYCLGHPLEGENKINCAQSLTSAKEREEHLGTETKKSSVNSCDDGLSSPFLFSAFCFSVLGRQCGEERGNSARNRQQFPVFYPHKHSMFLSPPSLCFFLVLLVILRRFCPRALTAQKKNFDCSEGALSYLGAAI